MTDFRFKKIEMTQTEHNRRLGDHDKLHTECATRGVATQEMIEFLQKADNMHQETLAMHQETLASHQHMVKVMEEGTALFQQLLRYLRWIGVVAKWFTAVGAAIATCWIFIKFVLTKFGLYL